MKLRRGKWPADSPLSRWLTVGRAADPRRGVVPTGAPMPKLERI
ncbi:hypothetical protein L195_g022818 [Trifolium pratense]|uniref:Uncharacterized protein n=1 Tax=Trifolium pratense TaxID=57577 RepID=A0A2K3N943_TRIPR|nr:hypothetical protein L195_g022818 [Trifolium pratense]